MTIFTISPNSLEYNSPKDDREHAGLLWQPLTTGFCVNPRCFARATFLVPTCGAFRTGRCPMSRFKLAWQLRRWLVEYLVNFFGVEETVIDAASAQNAVMYGPARGPVICRLDFHGWCWQVIWPSHIPRCRRSRSTCRI